jgi:hypothetical protein
MKGTAMRRSQNQEKISPTLAQSDWNQELQAAFLSGERLACVGEAPYSRASCVADRNHLFNAIKRLNDLHLVSDQDLSVLWSLLLAHYLECILDTEFEARMAKWSNRLVNSWMNY